LTADIWSDIAFTSLIESIETEIGR
jgi:hypothetical protein